MATTLEGLLELNDGFRSAALVQFANSEDLVTEIRCGASADKVAAKKGWDSRRTLILLRALVAEGLARFDNGEFYPSPLADKYLRPSSAEYIGDVIEHSRLQWELWGQLPAVMAAVEPHHLQQDVRFAADRHTRETFGRAMTRLANRSVLGEVLSNPRLTSTGLIVDVGGGKGHFLAALLARNPWSEGELWDEAHIVDEVFSVLGTCRHPSTGSSSDTPDRSDGHPLRGLAGRVEVRAVDLWSASSVPAAQSAEIVMLNDRLHMRDAEQMTEILELCVRAAEPGGRLSILTPWLDDNGTSPQWQALFSWYMAVNAFNGGIHPVSEVVDCLRGLGVESITIDRIGPDRGSAHIVGVVA